MTLDKDKPREVKDEDLPLGSEALRAASRVSVFAAVSYVRIVSASFSEEALDPSEQQLDDVKFSSSFNVSAHSEGLVSKIRLNIEVPLATVDAGEQDLPSESVKAVIAATFEVAYTFDNSAETAHLDTDVICFGRINALFNSWPYWREYVQSSMLRMNLPPIAVPLLRPQEAVGLAGLGPKPSETPTAPGTPTQTS